MKLLPSKLRNFVKWRSISDLANPGKKLCKAARSLLLNNSRIKVDLVRSGWAISMIVEGMSFSIQVRKLYSN